MGGGKIDCYIDIASYYSYLAYVHLLNNQAKLASYNVEVEFHPVLIAGINGGSGNKPPWMLPAKAKYLAFDSRRSAERAGVPIFGMPKDFMKMSMTILPLRALHYIKSAYPLEAYQTAFRYLFHVFWTPPHMNITVPEVLKDALLQAPSDIRVIGSKARKDEDGTSQLFTSQEVDRILQAAQEEHFKEALKAKTDEALKKGAFGLPWLWVQNAEGKEEPFFGSDRFHFIYRYLDLPFQDIELRPTGSPKSLL